SGLGVVAISQSRFEDALAAGEEGLSLYRELGSDRGVAMVLHNLGTIEWLLARTGHGRARFEAALELLRAAGGITTQALCLSALGRAGGRAGARTRLLERASWLERIESAREGGEALQSVAEWLLATGRAVGSAGMVGAAESARATVGTRQTPPEAVEIGKLMA